MNKQELEQLKAVISGKEKRWKAGARRTKLWLRDNWIQTTVVLLCILLLLSFCAGGD